MDGREGGNETRQLFDCWESADERKKNKLVDGTGILQMKCARYQCKSDLFSEWKSIRKKSPKFISFGYYVSIEKKSMYPKSIHGRAISRISLELISTIWAN